MAKKKTDKHQQKVEGARREVSFRLERLRQSMDREVAWLPKGEKWMRPLLALAVGSALATGAAAKRKNRSEPADERD